MADLRDALIVGYGAVGKRVAQLLREQGRGVTVLARSVEKGDELAGTEIEFIRGNLDEPETLVKLPTKGRVIFYCAPPPGGGNTDPRMHNFCRVVASGAEPDTVVYISTSGVYGDCGDGVVTEETPAIPRTARGKRRLDAENAVLSWGKERGVKIVILRVTGIYGPGRLPVSQLAQGHPVVREDQASITNRIHMEDLARVCLAAAEKGELGDIFNVSDGNPSTMTHYFNAVADALGYPRPPQVPLEKAHEVMSPLMLSYISESRRLDNSKMLNKLGIKLLYPTLEEGLKASVGKSAENV